MSAAYSDRNLLFGVLALQMEFLDRDALIAALNAWIHDKARPLGDILVEQKTLRSDERDALDLLVQKHLDRHHGDIEKSLAAVAISTPLREDLHNLADPDVQASVAHLPATSEADEPGPLPSTVSVAKPADGLRYLVLRPHDKGGIGEVFVALDQELNRQVALKEIQERHAADAHSRGRFVREAEITGGLEHPGIVPVYGLGQYADGRPFYAMRFIQGETLKDAIARYHRTSTDGSGARSPEFEFRSLLTRFVAVCNTIAYAHSRGVIHRDIKPSNIMLGKYGETLVVDWGMAKAGMHEPVRNASDGLPEPTLVPSLTDAIETQAGAAMGTPAYMSPEQASGRLDLLGPASDIYSLGATLYTLLTGRPSIEGKETAEVLRKAQRGEWLPPRQVKPDLSLALDAVCCKAMAPTPSERYATALALAADVERWLAEEPVLAYREPWTARSRRWMRRHRTLVSTVVGVLVIALLSATVGLVIIGDAWDKEATARQTAESEREEARTQKEEARFNQYVAQMNLVQREYEINNIAHVRELLEAQVPRDASSTDFRNFEWYYWQRMAHRELLILNGQMGRVDVVAFSPDGRWLASAGDSTVRVWDAANGQELLAFKGHTGSVKGVSFSPDGRRLASASDDQTVRVWDAATGKMLLILRHTEPVKCVSFSPDGLRLATASNSPRFLFLRSDDQTASDDQAVRVWDAATGKELLTIKWPTIVVNLAFSPDGRRLAGAGGAIVHPLHGREIRLTGDRQIVRIWDATTGRELLTIKGSTVGVAGVAFSPDGLRLASAVGETVRVWNAATGKELLTIKGHTSLIHAVSFSPDGQRLASASDDQTVRVWDASSGQQLLSLKGHSGPVYGLAFSPDNRRLASASHDRTVRVWDAGTEQELFTIGNQPSLFRGVAFSPDGRRLATAGNEAVSVWDTGSGEELLTLEGHTNLVSGVSFSPDGRRLASASHDGTVRVWDAASAQELLTLKGHTESFLGVAFSSDGRRLASASRPLPLKPRDNQTVRVWDAGSGQELLTIKGTTVGNAGVTFSPDGRRLASAAGDGSVRVWDASSGQELLSLKGHSGPVYGVEFRVVYGVAFSPDGLRLTSASPDGTIRVWNASSGQELLTLKGHSGPVYGVAFSPDSLRLASASRDGTVRVWDVATGQELLILRRGHTGYYVYGLVFSPDGSRLILADARTVSVWEALAVPEGVWRRRKLVSQVDSLFQELGLRKEVLDTLRREPTLSETDREFALRVARRHPENSSQLYGAAWKVVETRDSGKDVYARALRQAEAAVHLTPESGLYLRVLGVAQYRVGRYAEALVTLTKSEKVNATKQGSLPSDLAFLAMTQHQLGKKDEAQATLGRLREVMRDPRWENIPEAANLLREVEELIESKADKKK